MRVHIVAVGRMRRSPLLEVFEDYRKRSQWRITLKEIADSNTASGRPDRKAREAEQLLAGVPNGARVIALDENGRDLSSHDFAGLLGDWRDQGVRETVFLIGGPDGHGQTVLDRADSTMRLGRLTWPHLMVRVMLMEQIYRAQTILQGHPYHRG